MENHDFCPLQPVAASQDLLYSPSWLKKQEFLRADCPQTGVGRKSAKVLRRQFKDMLGEDSLIGVFRNRVGTASKRDAGKNPLAADA